MRCRALYDDCGREKGEAERNRGSILAYPQVRSSKETTTVGLLVLGLSIVMCMTSLIVTVVPLEDVPWIERVEVAAKLLRLKFTPSQPVRYPVMLGRAGLKGVKTKGPVAVNVAQPVPAPIPEVR